MKKFVVAAIVALTGSIAMAGALDAARYDYSDETGYKAAPCVDGTKKVFTEQRPNLDGQMNVVRTCVNGTFFPKANVVILACKEGSITWEPTGDGFTDRTDWVAKVCRGGKYVNVRN